MIDSLMRLGLKNIGSRFTLTYLSGFLKFSTSFCDIDHYHILSKSSEKKIKTEILILNSKILFLVKAKPTTFFC